MIVVSDASPLIALAKIGGLAHLPALFESVVIPPAVERELAVPSDEPDRLDVLRSCEGWLTVREPSGLLELTRLGAGETAAISLALELRTSTVLIDERRGRKVAEGFGMTALGTIGILSRAAKQGLLDLEDAFARLAATDFRYSAAMMDRVLNEYRSLRKAGS